MGVSVLKNYCIILVFYLCITLVLCNSFTDDELQTIQLECLKKEKPQIIDILMLRLGYWNTGIGNIKLQKWVLCVLVHHGLMTKRGVFRQDQALARVSKNEQELLIRRIDRCLYKKIHYPHEIAWNYLRCMNKGNPLGLRLQ